MLHILKVRRSVLAAWLLIGASAPASAQLAVVDVSAIAKLVSQIRILEAQLLQAQTEFASITGGRGMELLLAGTVRNYLPPNWAELESVLRGVSGGYGQLASQLQAVISSNAVLTEEQIAGLSPEER